MLGFLIYMNRSGSTLLSRYLDEYNDIGVTPEARFPDGIFFKERMIRKQEDIDPYLDLLYSNHKFRSWNIPRNQLHKSFSRLSFPAGFRETFPVIMQQYFGDDPPDVQLYKSPYIHNLEELRKIFPQALVILIYRDIRAVYNSKKKTIDTDLNRPMAASPFWEVVQYKKMLKTRERYKNKPWFHELKYEDLVTEPVQEISKLLESIGVSAVRKKEDSGYYSKLSEKQKQIHGNLQKKPLEERIYGWKEELDRASLWLFQVLLRKRLKQQGFPLVTVKLRRHDYFLLLLYLFVFMKDYAFFLYTKYFKGKYRV